MGGNNHPVAPAVFGAHTASPRHNLRALSETRGFTGLHRLVTAGLIQIRSDRLSESLQDTGWAKKPFVDFPERQLLHC